ncbi:MAG TPA: 2OG-Fe(II) oxygenase family protein, partial [Rhodopila sp.]
GPNLWPELPGFRDTLLTYYDAMLALGVALHRAMALDLGLAPSFFDDKFGRPLATLRLLHYPAAPDGASRPLGAGTHTDYGNLTLLATDTVGGLEVRRRDGAWIPVAPAPGTLVCNVGDCLMRWTNDVYMSTPHRVRQPAAERYSVAYFCDPNPDALVEALPGCVPAGSRPKYPPISAAAYLRSRLDPTYAHWKASAAASS